MIPAPTLKHPDLQIPTREEIDTAVMKATGKSLQQVRKEREDFLEEVRKSRILLSCYPRIPDEYYYKHPVPVWQREPHSPKYFQCFGKKFYNGGCVREGKWYVGEIFPFPILPKGLVWEYKMYWGWQIVKES